MSVILHKPVSLQISGIPNPTKAAQQPITQYGPDNRNAVEIHLGTKVNPLTVAELSSAPLVGRMGLKSKSIVSDGNSNVNYRYQGQLLNPTQTSTTASKKRKPRSKKKSSAKDQEALIASVVSETAVSLVGGSTDNLAPAITMVTQAAGERILSSADLVTTTKSQTQKLSSSVKSSNHVTEIADDLDDRFGNDGDPMYQGGAYVTRN